MHSRLQLSPLLAIFLLGVSSGFPLALTASGGTFQALATDRGFNLIQLGQLTFLMLPFALKFLWAPFFDRFACPGFKFLGFRKGWLFVTQASLGIIYLLLGHVHTVSPSLILILFALSFFSASQDIVIDAYRAEVLKPKLRGAGASLAVLGYRIGMILSGAGALALGDILPWEHVFSICALVQLTAAIPTIFANAEASVERPKTIATAIKTPFIEFWQRGGALEVLLFVFLFKAPDALGTLFTTRFLLDCGFSRTDIAAVVKGIGLISVLAGGAAAGLVMVRMSLKRALLFFGLIQALTVLPFILLAHNSSADMSLLTYVIVAESFGAGASSTVFAAFLMGLCKFELAATQFALLTSVAALARSLLGPVAGNVASQLGWETYFMIAGLSNIPALLLLIFRSSKWRLGTGESF